MLNNIEQAITNVLTTKQTPDYHNVMDAYFRLCRVPAIGNPFAVAETTLLFERAMDKYPDVGEKVGFQAPFAKLIADFRKTQWELKIELLGKAFGERFPCPCRCGVLTGIDDVRRKLNLLDDMAIEAPPATSKKLKSRRRINNKIKKSKGKTLAFDLYGPSTSASSM